jgi:FkbM family methyltransferase
VEYFEQGKWWMPDGETHLQDWMLKKQQKAHGRLGYQLHKFEAALRETQGRGMAVDVGGHVGLWSWPMAHAFAGVVAFEPIAAHRDCYERNMESLSNWRLYGCALGTEDANVRIAPQEACSSGGCGVVLPGAAGEDVVQRRLDDFHLVGVDLLKIDCEGYELFVLHGAVDTLRRNRPTVIVEQKPETGGAARYGIDATAAVTFLRHMGMNLRAAIQGDYVLSFDKR